MRACQCVRVRGRPLALEPLALEPLAFEPLAFEDAPSRVRFECGRMCSFLRMCSFIRMCSLTSRVRFERGALALRLS